MRAACFGLGQLRGDGCDRPSEGKETESQRPLGECWRTGDQDAAGWDSPPCSFLNVFFFFSFSAVVLCECSLVDLRDGAGWLTRCFERYAAVQPAVQPSCVQHSIVQPAVQLRIVGNIWLAAWLAAAGEFWEHCAGEPVFLRVSLGRCTDFQCLALSSQLILLFSIFFRAKVRSLSFLAQSRYLRAS